MLVEHWEEQSVCEKIDWWGAGIVFCLEWGANDLHMVRLMPMPQCHPIISCFIKIQIGLTFLVLAYPGCAVKEAVKRVSVLQLNTMSTEQRNSNELLSVDLYCNAVPYLMSAYNCQCCSFRVTEDHCLHRRCQSRWRSDVNARMDRVLLEHKPAKSSQRS